MDGIFISYRREDSGGHAGRLRDRLRARFGRRVFQDVDGIADGDVFENTLEHALDTCEVALIVIGRTWLTCKDEHGRRRLDDPEDWVRIETRMLLSRDNRVIPVLVGGATMPRAADLPEDLLGLVKWQSRELRDAAWDADVAALTNRLSDILATNADEGSTSGAFLAIKNRRRAAVGALLWHRMLIAKRYDGSTRRGPGRPPVPSEIRALIMRMATENRGLGYTRIRGALANLDHEVSRGKIANLLREHRLEPAPDRLKKTTWTEFLKTHWEVLPAADFFTVDVWTRCGLSDLLCSSSSTYPPAAFTSPESRRSLTPSGCTR